MEKDQQRALNLEEGPSAQEMATLRDTIQKHAKELSESNDKYKKQ